jgi:hypothetical protein
MDVNETETMFLTELEKYENKWVALIQLGDSETIVGSGDNAVTAKQSAESRGYKDTILYKVQSFDRGYIPSGQ